MNALLRSILSLIFIQSIHSTNYYISTSSGQEMWGDLLDFKSFLHPGQQHFTDDPRLLVKLNSKMNQIRTQEPEFFTMLESDLWSDDEIRNQIYDYILTKYYVDLLTEYYAEMGMEFRIEIEE